MVGNYDFATTLLNAVASICEGFYWDSFVWISPWEKIMSIEDHDSSHLQMDNSRKSKIMVWQEKQKILSRTIPWSCVNTVKSSWKSIPVEN